MDRECEILYGGAHLDRERGLGHELRGMCPDNLRANHGLIGPIETQDGQSLLGGQGSWRAPGPRTGAAAVPASIPSSFASSGVSPTAATSGSVNITSGTLARCPGGSASTEGSDGSRSLCGRLVREGGTIDDIPDGRDVRQRQPGIVHDHPPAGIGRDAGLVQTRGTRCWDGGRRTPTPALPAR